MDKLTTKITFFLFIITALVGIVAYSSFTGEKELTGVPQGNTYNYTQLTGVIATTSTIVAGQSTLGSVIITEDQAGAVVLWDATSSAAITDGTYATRVADFQTASTEGTYVFDTGVTYGLIYISDDGYVFDGDWTITWRYGL